MGIHTDLMPLTRAEPGVDALSPVVGAHVIAGLIPANVVAEEILTDHPARYRAMMVQSANPAHSLADSPSFRRALEKLELVVCVDVAMTETARLADYVLPAASQFEKWECTWFNFEFPHNTFHLRAPLLDPLPGTMPEAEIFTRLVESLGALDGIDLEPLHAAASAGRAEFAAAFAAAVANDPRVGALAPLVLYRTLGPTLPDGAAMAAPIWGLARRFAATEPEAVRRAGHAGADPAALGEALFDAMLAGRSGVTISAEDHHHTWNRVNTADGRINLVIEELLAEFATLSGGPSAVVDLDFPLVLAAGERRSFTANTILRDPSWRRREAHGGLRVAPADAAALGFVDGDAARLVTRGGTAGVTIDVDPTMQAGAIALPNGFGTDFPGEDGAGELVTGVAPNELTQAQDRDPIAGTPWHKHVPARLERIS